MTDIEKGDPVTLKEFPDVTGTVVSRTGDTAVVREDAEPHARVEHEVQELRKLEDAPLPDKSWPPSGLESKSP